MTKIIVFLSILFLLLHSSALFASIEHHENLRAEDYFTKEQIELGKSYRTPKFWMWLGENLLLIIFLMIFTFTPVGEKVRDFCSCIGNGKYWLTAASYGFVFICLWNIFIFPLTCYRSYFYEHKFLCSNQTFNNWIKDYLISESMTIIIFVIAVTVFYLVMRACPKHWWLIGWTGFCVFIISATYLLPLLIMPVFNKFEVLPSGKLREGAMEIVKKAGINNVEIYVMDASRRTKKGNAYFVGLGNSTRIVLYDTLKDNYSYDETISVLAHEAGHWKHNHIIKGIILSIPAGFCFFLFLYFLLNSLVIRGYISSVYDIKSLSFMIMFFLFVNITTMPVQNTISRYFEREADMTSLQLTDNSDAFISLERKLACQNLSDLTPEPLFVWFFYTHPPVMERINMGENYKNKIK